jgi:hypothetical protein
VHLHNCGISHTDSVPKLVQISGNERPPYVSVASIRPQARGRAPQGWLHFCVANLATDQDTPG